MNPGRPDPDLARLAPGEGHWRVAYRMGAGTRVGLVLMGFLGALLFLMLGAFLVFCLALAMRHAGGAGPWARGLVHDHGCGTLVGLAVAAFVGRALWRALRIQIAFLRDLGAQPQVWRGQVEALRELGPRRLLILKGRVLDITEALYKSLREDEPIVAEVKPHAPTLLVLLVKGHGR